jgi:hypothetical protein
MNQCRHIFRLAILSLALAAAVGGWTRAESPAPAEPPAQPPSIALPDSGSKIEYVGPDTFLLLDAAGRPQPVLGMSYEEFVAAWKKLQHVEADRGEPRFTIDELRINGSARDDRAELNVDLTIQSLAAGPIKVPLGMADAILLEQPRLPAVGEAPTQGPADLLVAYEPKAGGYVVWIDGPPRERHRMTFKILRPIERVGSDSILGLNLPRALVSEFSLRVLTPILDATTTAGALTRERVDAGETKLVVTGPSGDFRLSWNTTSAERPELATVLSSVGAIAITIDGHSIRSDARLTVRSYGGEFERFRVRLPSGAQLVQDRPTEPGAIAPAYRLIVESSAAASGRSNDERAQIVTVELAEKQLGPVDVEISTEQPLGLPTAERAMELSGFEVLGAVRQFGDVAISVADDWQLRWENGPYVRQVEQADLPAVLRAVLPGVAFQYDRQPWSLRAQLVARPMVVHVTPEYTLDLSADEALLHVHLDYQVPGARAFEFRMQLAGWELTPEPIESNGLVDRDRVMVTRDGVLVLPLAQAAPRRADVLFDLRRAVPRNVAVPQLPLPTPEADTVAAANLVVRAAASIELLPNVASSRGLSATPVTSDVPLDAAGDGSQTFFFRTFGPDAVFAAERTIRPSDATAEIDTHLDVTWQRLMVEQDISYDVRYQPLDGLEIALPEGWSIAGDQIAIVPTAPGAKPIVLATATEAAATGKSTRIARAKFTQPRLGRFQLHVEYQVDEVVSALGVGANLLALPQPRVTRVREHRATVAAAPNLDVTLDATANSAWSIRRARGAASPALFTAAGSGEELPLIVQPIARDLPQTTTVERVWLQTWQAGNTIQDRAAFRFRTAGDAVVIELPPLSTVRDVEVLVDGELAKVSTRQEGRLTVELPSNASTTNAAAPSHTLEFRYRHPAPVGLVLRHTLTPPQMVGTSTLSEVYWQVILPGDRHVVSSPEQLIPIDPRQWLEVFSGRAASKSQADLESWVGATNQLSPTQSQNAYLYSGLAPVASIEMLTAPRWLIVLVSSAVVLAAVTVWLYVPVARRAWIALALAAIVAGLAIAYPDPAVLVGQAALLGIGLAAIGVALRRWTRSRVVSLPPPTNSNSTNLRIRSSLRTDSYATPSLSASTSGTPTAPLVMLPEVER